MASDIEEDLSSEKQVRRSARAGRSNLSMAGRAAPVKRRRSVKRPLSPCFPSPPPSLMYGGSVESASIKRHRAISPDSAIIRPPDISRKSLDDPGNDSPIDSHGCPTNHVLPQNTMSLDFAPPEVSSSMRGSLSLSRPEPDAAISLGPTASSTKEAKRLPLSRAMSEATVRSSSRPTTSPGPSPMERSLSPPHSEPGVIALPRPTASPSPSCVRPEVSQPAPTINSHPSQHSTLPKLADKAKLYIHCESLQLYPNSEDVEPIASRPHPFITRVAKTYEIHSNPDSPSWDLTRRIFRFACFGKELMKTISPNYDVWCPWDLATTLEQAGNYMAISEDADISDVAIRRLYATHNLVVLPEHTTDRHPEPAPFEASRIARVFNIDPGAPIMAQSKEPSIPISSGVNLKISCNARQRPLLEYS